MKLALVGVGNAGNRIVDRILARETETNRHCTEGNVLVFNTDAAVFEELEYVPEARQVLIGDTYHGVKGTGVEGDLELAVSVAKEELNEIHRSFDEIETYDVDAILLVAGLGGATGSGVGSVILEELGIMFEKPVYTIGVLPSTTEDGFRSLFAARALRTFVPESDNVLLFDNDTWFTSDKTHEKNYGTANDTLAERIIALVGTGENKALDVPENCVDPTDIMRTLDTGGVSAIGYATTTVSRNPRGLIDRIRLWLSRNNQHDPDADEMSDAERVRRLVRRAVTSELTIPCEVASAERTLIVLSGPPETMSRKGFETARYWLEQEADTVEVLAGDEPHGRSPTLSAVVLLSNVTDVPRITDLKEKAVTVQETLPDAAESAPEADFRFD